MSGSEKNARRFLIVFSLNTSRQWTLRTSIQSSIPGKPRFEIFLCSSIVWKRSIISEHSDFLSKKQDGNSSKCINFHTCYCICSMVQSQQPFSSSTSSNKFLKKLRNIRSSGLQSLSLLLKERLFVTFLTLAHVFFWFSSPKVALSLGMSQFWTGVITGRGY